MTFGVFLVALIAASVGLSLIMAGAWFVQQRTGNSGWVDTVWTFGLGAVGIAGALAPLGGWLPRGLLIAALIFAWALRLGLHIATRTAKITDDPRYAELQRGWGAANARGEMFWLLQRELYI
jgi:steroid 5-alpha reductase family enzyme